MHLALSDTEGGLHAILLPRNQVSVSQFHGPSPLAGGRDGVKKLVGVVLEVCHVGITGSKGVSVWVVEEEMVNRA
jgi:hypothetical protein